MNDVAKQLIVIMQGCTNLPPNETPAADFNDVATALITISGIPTEAFQQDVPFVQQQLRNAAANLAAKQAALADAWQNTDKRYTVPKRLLKALESVPAYRAPDPGRRIIVDSLANMNAELAAIRNHSLALSDRLQYAHQQATRL